MLELGYGKNYIQSVTLNEIYNRNSDIVRILIQFSNTKNSNIYKKIHIKNVTQNE